MECIRCGEQTPIEDATCTKCEKPVHKILGEEAYSAEPDGDGYVIAMTDARGDADVVACACGCQVLEVEFADTCSYCDHVASKDD